MALSIKELKKGSHIHFMGICGVAMASMAGTLKDMGYKITGSDQNVYPPMSDQLQNLGIAIQEGYRASNLKPKPDFVIVGNVITKNHEEAIALLNSDIPYTSLPKAIGDMLIDNRKSVVISGTHGKTTTTSIMSWIFSQLNKKPGFMIGGIAKNFSKSFQVPKGDYFIIEGDEYDTAFFDKVPKFNHYKPYYAILGSIEFDHADIYQDLDAVMTAFYGLAKRLNPEGLFVYNSDSENTQKVASRVHKGQRISYGLNSGDYQAKNIHYQPEAMSFDLMYKKELLINVKTSLFGDYNILNLLPCLALCNALGFPLKEVVKAISTFEGVKRRQEILSNKNDIFVIEDFAHHPTAVLMTIEAVKKRFQKGRVIAVFEPRSATSRRNIFQQDYIRALSKADFIFVKQASMQEKISKDKRFSSVDLIQSLKQMDLKAEVFDNVDIVTKEIAKIAKSGDAIVLMSNGSFDGIYTKLLNALPN